MVNKMSLDLNFQEENLLLCFRGTIWKPTIWLVSTLDIRFRYLLWFDIDWDDVIGVVIPSWLYGTADMALLVRRFLACWSQIGLCSSSSSSMILLLLLLRDDPAGRTATTILDWQLLLPSCGQVVIGSGCTSSVSMAGYLFLVLLSPSHHFPKTYMNRGYCKWFDLVYSFAASE